MGLLEPIGWLDDGHYVVQPDTSLDEYLAVLTTSGKVVKSIKLPRGTPAMPKTPVKSTLNNFMIHLGYGADYRPNSGLRL